MQQNSPFLLGDWQVEPGLNRLSRNDEEVIVVPKVMALLLVLVEHRPEPLGQDKLIELVWPAQVVSDSSVYQAVAQLRKALGDSASEPRFIERVSGKGYRLIAEVAPLASEQPSFYHSTLPKMAVGIIFVWTLLLGSWYWSAEQSSPAVDKRNEIESLTLVDLAHLSQGKPNAVNALNQVLLTQLTQFSELKVIHVKTPPQTFNTDVVLTGSINEQGEQVQVFLQLKNSEDDSVVWAKMFAASTDQIFSLQNDINTALLKQLKRKAPVSGFAQSQIDKRSFNQYLLARHLWQQRTEDALLQAKGIFEQMAQDGQLFPLAAVGLCETYHFLHIYSDWPLSKTLKACEPLLDKALEAQPNLGEAIASKALLKSTQGDRGEAEKLFKQALALAPNYAFGLMWYGNLIRDMGQFDQALQVTQKAYELSPMSPVINRSLAYSYLTLSRFSDARYYYQRAITLEPDHFARPVQNLDFLPLNVERARAFLAWKQKNTNLVMKSPYYQMTHVQIQLSLGKLDEATALFNKIDHSRINPAFLLYMKASFKTAEGDLAAAADLLKQRMVMHPDKRRFVMPYLSNLYYRGQYEQVHQALIKFAPEYAEPDIAITKDNQFMVAFYLMLAHKRGQLEQNAQLLARLDKWFADNEPLMSSYYARWLVFREHPDAEKKIKKMLNNGWLPDYNEDMLGAEHMLQLFEKMELSPSLFKQKLNRNRSVTVI